MWFLAGRGTKLCGLSQSDLFFCRINVVQQFFLQPKPPGILNQQAQFIISALNKGSLYEDTLWQS